MNLAETNMWDFLNLNGGGIALFIIMMSILIGVFIILILEQRQGRL